jgi:hypothetical protein
MSVIRCAIATPVVMVIIQFYQKLDSQCLRSVFDAGQWSRACAFLAQQLLRNGGR